MILINLIKTYICVDNNKIKYFKLEDMMVIITLFIIFIYFYEYKINKFSKIFLFICTRFSFQNFLFLLYYYNKDKDSSAYLFIYTPQR